MHNPCFGPMRPSRTSVKIYFSLLCLCYLEVVLWTACLLTSTGVNCEAVAGQAYLGRETGNLKWGNLNSKEEHTVPFHELYLLNDLHIQLEHLYLQQQLDNLLSITSSQILQHGQLHELRVVPAVKGLPAPYTGISAID